MFLYIENKYLSISKIKISFGKLTLKENIFQISRKKWL